MNRSEIFTTLLEKRPWTDYEWEKELTLQEQLLEITEETMAKM